MARGITMACLLALLLLGALPGLQAKSCAQLGFTASLLCSGCKQLEDYVPDAELVADCRKCCAEDAVESDTRVYVSAVLEFCPHSLRGFPHLETFVEKIAPDVDNLTLRRSLGVRPRLIMKAEDGTRNTVRIDAWKTEHIQEYLKDKLKGPEEVRGGWGPEDDDDDLEDS